MKQLGIGIGLLLAIALLGFLYRNDVEQPPIPKNPSVAGVACSADAKICPDGSVVSRGGPDCSFAVCALPNIEIDLASTTLSFVLPSGYQKTNGTNATNNDASVLGNYEQTAADPSKAGSIQIREFPIPSGSSGSAAMLSNTIFNPSGLTATSTSEFSNIQIGKNLFSVVNIERSEGAVQDAYYIEQGNTLFRFDITDKGVQNYADPNLNVKTLPQHEAFVQMLSTLDIESR